MSVRHRHMPRNDQLAQLGVAALVVGVCAALVHLQRRTRRWYKAAIPASLSDKKVFLVEWPMCTLYMMNDTQYPAWVMMVPRKADTHEVTQLGAAEQTQLWKEMMRATSALEAAFAPDKMNVASIGNMVPDLHVHVTCRRRGDVAWPGPCYGAAPQQPFEKSEMDAQVARLRECLQPPSLLQRLFW